MSRLFGVVRLLITRLKDPPPDEEEEEEETVKDRGMKKKKKKKRHSVWKIHRMKTVLHFLVKPLRELQ